MRARIYQPCSGGLYWGQIYNEEYKYWKNVTPSCFTKWGVKKELEKWKRKHCPEEFEIWEADKIAILMEEQWKNY